MVNLNRLFPRLSITAKLVIAFVLLALGPSALVMAMGTISTVGQMRARERELLEHDLERAGEQTAHSIRELSRQLRYMGTLGMERLLARPGSVDQDAIRRTAETYLRSDLSQLFRVKVVDPTGRAVLAAQGPTPTTVASDRGSAQPLYAWLASELGAGEVRFVPVELRGASGDALVPAVAVVAAVRDADGALLGALVGEALAADVFAGIDQASPGAEGVTGVVDEEGHFLYHTLRKRDWSTLLAQRSQVGVESELPAEVAAAILSGRAGTVRASGGIVTTFRSLTAPGLRIPAFYLYRTFPQATLGASVRRYLTATGLVTLLVILSVLAIAVIAARQITRPLHRLQDAARRVSTGLVHEPLEIETNDEIQDLAEDFEVMAAEVARHRERLEAAVDERTRSLQRAEAELSRVVSMSADAIVGLDQGGLVRLWNRGAEQLFGYTAPEATGRPLEELVRPEGPRGRQEEAYLRRKLDESGAVVAFQTVRRTKSGEEIPVGLTYTLLRDDAGEPVGSSVIFRDARMTEQMQESMRRSERLSAVSIMAAGLAHELNNPVAILGNRIELMEREVAQTGGSERLRRDIHVLRQHVDRLGGITGDLLRFARDDTESVGPIQANDVVARVVRLLDSVLASRGVSLEQTLSPDLPPVLASANAVETVLVNLVLNAEHASPAGAAVTVTTRARKDSGRVEIEVRDAGEGVPSAIRHRIFEPFFTTKAESGGSGLGLAVCRALMEQQGGTIHLAAENGVGASFVLSFQVA